tara:strand:+ start:50 stop:592 length:543 start_codon:yes stop_codon:yes gene_type:complete
MDNKTEEKEKFGMYPTCLSCYNNGSLVGYWFRYDENTTEEDIEKSLEVEEIHKQADIKTNSYCDEVFISDYEFLEVDEYTQPKEIFEMLEVFKELEYELGLYYLENKNDYTIEELKEAQKVNYSDYEDFVYEYFETYICYDFDINAISSFLDMEKIKRWFQERNEVIDIENYYYYYIVSR